MTLLAKRIVAGILALFLAAPLAQAQRSYSQAELDRMLAPIALYPDALLSQVLMAATYPIEVAAAARWSRANPHLKGDDAVRAVQDMDWDPSVKSLVAFAQLLARMDENLEWTRALGDAFLAQQPHVMETIQQLRRRARAAGNLQSSEQIQVEQQGPVIVVQPAQPHYVYVPYYDPLVVYGAWWWPAYPPVAWAPWPGYARYPRPGISVGFWWGGPIAVSAGFFFGNVDWRERHVRVVHVNNYYVRPPVRREVHVREHVGVAPGRWQHNPHHRRGVEYRDVAVRSQFAAAPQRREERRPENREQPRQLQAPAPRPQAAPQREERRFRKPPARDVQDSKVLTPQRPQPQALPRPQPQIQQHARPTPPPQEARIRAQREHRPEQREQRREHRAHEERNERGRRGGDRS